MFMGVNSHTDAQRVTSYETACAALERASRTPTGRARKSGAYGYHLGMNNNSGVTWVRRNESNGNIAFRLYNTDVVTWCPDGSVRIDNFGSVTTSDFARRFLPGGIHLRYPSQRGGNRTIAYRAADDADRWSKWRVCGGDVVRFVAHGNVWLPDESTCDTMEFPERTGSTREIAKRFHLRDFEIWLSMAPMLLRIEHAGMDVDTCAAALEARDFRTAAAYLPLVSVTHAFGIAERIKPLPIITPWRDEVVTMSSLRKFKIALWEREGLFTTMSCKTIPQDEFERRMAQVREMAALGISVRQYGHYL